MTDRHDQHSEPRPEARTRGLKAPERRQGDRLGRGCARHERRKSWTHKLRTALVVGVLGLSSAGCSAGPAGTSTDESSGNAAAGVYEFQTNASEPSEEVTIRIPDELREVMGADADGMVVDLIAVSAHEIEGVQHCAADLSMSYLGNQPLDMVAANDAPTARESAVQDFIKTIPDSEVDDEASAIEWLDSAIEGRIANGYGESDIAKSFEMQFGTPADLESDTYLSAYEDGDTGREVLDRYVGSASDEEVPGTTIVAEGLGLDNAHPLTDLDESAPEPGTYVSEDYTTITIVDGCAASAADPEDAIEMTLPSLGPNGKSSTVASLELSVMTDGTIGVTGEVEDYMRDAHDQWIAR